MFTPPIVLFDLHHSRQYSASKHEHDKVPFPLKVAPQSSRRTTSTESQTSDTQLVMAPKRDMWSQEQIDYIMERTSAGGKPAEIGKEVKEKWPEKEIGKGSISGLIGRQKKKSTDVPDSSRQASSAPSEGLSHIQCPPIPETPQHVKKKAKLEPKVKAKTKPKSATPAESPTIRPFSDFATPPPSEPVTAITTKAGTATMERTPLPKSRSPETPEWELTRQVYPTHTDDPRLAPVTSTTPPPTDQSRREEIPESEPEARSPPAPTSSLAKPTLETEDIDETLISANSPDSVQGSFEGSPHKGGLGISNLNVQHPSPPSPSPVNSTPNSTSAKAALTSDPLQEQSQEVNLNQTPRAGSPSSPVDAQRQIEDFLDSSPDLPEIKNNSKQQAIVEDSAKPEIEVEKQAEDSIAVPGKINSSTSKISQIPQTPKKHTTTPPLDTNEPPRKKHKSSTLPKMDSAIKTNGAQPALPNFLE